MSIHAVIGSDEARVKEAALALSQKLSPPDAGEFGIEIVDGAVENADDASRRIHETIQALQTLPFFGGRKVVWLKNASFLADTVTGRAAATLEAADALAAFLKEGLPDNVDFLLSATEIDKRRSFFKTLGKVAELAVYDQPDMSRPGWESDMMAVVARRAKERRLSFDREALEFFVMLAGSDSRLIDSELEKIDLYLGASASGQREISRENVRQLVAHSRAGIIFEIGDAISKRQLPKALERVGHLLYHGENAIGILLGAIVPKVRSLLVAKDLLARHRISASSYRSFESGLNGLPEIETAALPRKKDGTVSSYPVFLAAQDCGRFKLEELKRGYAHCLEANRRLVTSQLEPRLVLDQLLTRLLT